MTRDDEHDEVESLEVIDLGSEVDQPPTTSRPSWALSRRRLIVGAIGVVLVATLAVTAHRRGTHTTQRTTVSSACATAMFTMAHDPPNVMDVTTAADEVATVVACRSPSEWNAAAARFTSTDAQWAPLLSLQQFCIQAREIATPTCKAN